jgi:hypothetical protein
MGMGMPVLLVGDAREGSFSRYFFFVVGVRVMDFLLFGITGCGFSFSFSTFPRCCCPCFFLSPTTATVAVVAAAVTVAEVVAGVVAGVVVVVAGAV